MKPRKPPHHRLWSGWFQHRHRHRRRRHPLRLLEVLPWAVALGRLKAFVMAQRWGLEMGGRLELGQEQALQLGRSFPPRVVRLTFNPPWNVQWLQAPVVYEV